MTADHGGSTLTELEIRLAELGFADARRLARRLQGARKVRDPRRRAAAETAVTRDVERAEQRLAARRASVPALRYPEALPVTARREEIRDAIRDHQVVIVAGETGSGKTTQLPKLCLEAGLGVRGMIGHTQPRRIAARAVAERIAEELDTPLGTSVGFKVRFSDQTSAQTLVKVMTDGILLAEIQQDRLLSHYDTIIIDEAHERSLNIDFILGYLKQLLPRRPDLTVVITSATIDPERFSRHFGDAPIIEVSGRTYPVEIRYRPLVADAAPDATSGDGEPRDQIDGICAAVHELVAEGPGDILVFLSGEREIRDTADAVARLDLSFTEVVPLYARLSTAEQHRIFQPHTGRRIVLATNVAETSLTVPGIRYVVDAGTARVSRYSHRLKVQRLPIEAISQASANQRAGRCGRVSDGICIRLYSAEDFASRQEFTDPEILRTNLAAVILQMAALDLGDVAAFPFVDPPDQRQVKDGIALLQELGALETSTGNQVRLTDTGRRLAQLPIDPRLGRMILAAGEHGCVREVTIIAAALSIQDPRERPADQQQAADELHRRFANPASDFLAFLALWRHLRERQRELSSNQFRRLCRREFLNYLRVREWQDLTQQLRQAAKTVDLAVSTTDADEEAIHAALLPGLLSHIGLYDAARRDYLGARNARFGISPGSALFRQNPRWIVAAELVETTRLWARIVARTDPRLVERAAAHLVKRTYSEPHWDRAQGAVMAVERVTLYGVPLVVGRRVNYGRIEPALARELFLRHALVEGDWETHHRFFAANRALLDEVEGLENRARRRDILVDDETLFAFYDARIPADVVSARHFDAWWKRARRTQPDLLTMTLEQLVSSEGTRVDPDDYPTTWQQGDLEFPLSYAFDPSSPNDGVTAHLPVAVLNRVDAEDFRWQVPGLRGELLTALIRGLPKAMRRSFVPAPAFAEAVAPNLEPRRGRLAAQLSHQLRRMTAVEVPEDAWDWTRVPPHLMMNFRVEDAAGRSLGEGRDLDELKARLAPSLRATLAREVAGVERTGLRTWDFDELPRCLQRHVGGHVVEAFPALVDRRTAVDIRVFENSAQQRVAMHAGVRRLITLLTPNPTKSVLGRLSSAEKLHLTQAPHESATALLDDCLACAVDSVLAEFPDLPWHRQEFERRLTRARAVLPDRTAEAARLTAAVLAAAHRVGGALTEPGPPALRPSLDDLRRQLAELVHPGFVTETGMARLPDVPRYLAAMERRLKRLPLDPARDRRDLESIEYLRARLAELRTAGADGAADRIRWMVEELRVSYFAQSLGTAYPVSEKRVLRAIDEVPA